MYLKVIEKAPNGNPFESTELGFLELQPVLKLPVFTFLHMLFSCTVTLLSYTPPLLVFQWIPK